jgi:hypothetical protein
MTQKPRRIQTTDRQTSTEKVADALRTMPISLREHTLRGLVGYIFFFTIGVISAGAYFYQIHPEQSLEADLPRIRHDVSEVLERGKRIRDAWHSPSEDPAPPEPQGHTEPARTEEPKTPTKPYESSSTR